MFQLIETYASDDPDTDAIGYSMWVDLERAPEEVLPWLGQFVGLKVPETGSITGAFVARNLVPNPSAEIDTYGAFSRPGTGGVLTSSSESSKFGGRSFKVVGDGAHQPLIDFTEGPADTDYIGVTPGGTYNFSVWVRSTAALALLSNAMGIGTSYFRPTGVQNGSNATLFTLTGSGVWTYINFPFTMPIDCDGLRLSINCFNTIAAGNSFFVDGLMVNEGLTPYPNYFDGDTNPDPSMATIWVGTPHKSVSELQIPDSMEAKKQILRDRLSWMRGTPAAMVAAAQTELTGAKRVVLRERFTGDPWKINVVTFTSETTDPSKVLDKLLSQKPAGIVLTHTVVDGQDYQILLDNHATYSDVLSTYATYGGVLLDVPGA
jgi:hypothetical protein